ncbi:protein of unknown function [Thermomonospora echinospora]|uniref:DUF4142 domain-containing protein n=2 Tax=Thermomonospora echinospora TaxID=1992 RepID=A0A1H5YTH6_9ACTN|nr:protein of unknown function [Thermomonospora echinospora]
MSILRAVLTAGAVIAFSAGAMSPAAARPGVPAQDRGFLIAAHQGNLTEIMAGKAAQQKAQASVVRAIGQRFVTDHTRLDTAVQDAARKLGVSLPMRPTQKQQAEYDRVNALSGSAFDRAWLEFMIREHRTAIAAGEQELRAGVTPEAKQVATSSAPVIQGHLQELLQAQKTVGTPQAQRATGTPQAQRATGTPQAVQAGAGGRAETTGQGETAENRRSPALGYGLLAAGLPVTVGGFLLWRRRALRKR